MFVKAGGPKGHGGGSDGGVDYGPEPPLPSDSDESFLRRPDTTERERERIRAVRPPEGGCFCNNNGCTGNACGTLNGCVCNSTGTCWGAACSARVPVVGSQPIAPMTSGQLVVTPTGTPILATPAITAPNLLTNSFQAIRSALVAPLQTMSVNGQQVQLQSGLMTSPMGGDCTCNSNGCVGNGCASLNGCFCVGQNCWGNACQAPIVSVQPNGRLINGMAQSGNFIDIPGLFGGGGGGGGGGMSFEGQTIPVVQGIPVTRLRGQGARRFRGGRGKGSMAMSSGRVRARVRPQVIKKRMKEVPEEPQDLEETTTDRNLRTRTEEEYGVRFDNDFLPFKTEVTKELMPSFEERFSPEDFEVDKRPEPSTRQERFAQKLQKSLAKFWKSTSDDDQDSGEQESQESDRRQDISSEPLVFAEDVLNVNILTLDENDDFNQ